MMAVSPPAQECAGRLYGFTSVIVANPFSHDVFSQARCGKKAAHNRLKIVFLGRLVPRKGPLELLRAVVVLREQGEPLPDFTVVLAGRGKLHSECERFVQEAGLTDVVSLPGFVAEADKAKLLESADLAVFPSTRGESFGISLLEAMAAARGVVLGGNNPGYASVMPWQNQLFRPGDTAAFAKCLAYWLTHADARAAAAKRQQAHARQYDIDTIGPNIINLYTQSSKKRGF
jgi:phosphatidylinositol alpha-mannosyltransferase